MSNSRTGASSRQVEGFRRHSGFTLIELLVVIGIIVILIGILIPAISHVRNAARAASTQSLLVELQSAIERYHMDYNAYPGPLSNDVMYGAVGTGLLLTAPDHISYPGGSPLLGRVSGSENLVLALMGGLRYDAGFAAGQSHIVYDSTIVGSGPRTLAYDFGGGGATGKTNQAKSAYLTSVADLSTNSVNNDGLNPGHFKDQSGEANDSTIPEFVDRFPSPMPILYLRARVGAPARYQIGPPANPWYFVISDANNVRNSPNGPVPAVGGASACQYDISQFFGYVGAFTGAWPGATGAVLEGQDRINTSLYSCIGESKTAQYWHGPANVGPYEASNLPTGYAPYHGLFAMMPYAIGNVGDPLAVTPAPAPDYFRNPAFGSANMLPAFAAQRAQNQPRGKDTYILISAGPDRVYGTADDITSFGPVMP